MVGHLPKAQTPVRRDRSELKGRVAISFDERDRIRATCTHASDLQFLLENGFRKDEKWSAVYKTNYLEYRADDCVPKFLDILDQRPNIIVWDSISLGTTCRFLTDLMESGEIPRIEINYFWT